MCLDLHMYSVDQSYAVPYLLSVGVYLRRMTNTIRLCEY